MKDLLKIVLEKGDHWSLGILLFAILILGLLRLPVFSPSTNVHTYKVVLNFLWAIVGLSAIYIIVVLIRDISKNQKDVELAKIEASLKTIKEKHEIIQSDSSLKNLFSQASKLVFPQLPPPDPHPIEDNSIDHSRCWIKIGYGIYELLKSPSWNHQGIIANEIPPKIYYVITKKREPQFNKLFFKIKLDNGLEGWVEDHRLDKNPICYN